MKIYVHSDDGYIDVQYIVIEESSVTISYTLQNPEQKHITIQELIRAAYDLSPDYFLIEALKKMMEKLTVQIDD